MLVLVHDASTDKKSIANATWKPCPFCSGTEIGICSTGSYVAVQCKALAQCGFEFYKSGSVETVNQRWNQRSQTHD